MGELLKEAEEQLSWLVVDDHDYSCRLCNGNTKGAGKRFHSELTPDDITHQGDCLVTRLRQALQPDI